MEIKTQAIDLRPAIEADRDAIAEIWHESASMPGVGPPVIPSLAELRERVDREFDAGWQVTVAVRDDRILGFLAIKPAEAVLAELFLRPEAIGMGIGRVLLAHAKKAMPAGFTLLTRSANARARRFYERAGLRFLRDDVHPRAGDPITYYGWHVR
jgi:ribosomal protein S18 acetylase RimI-like enzyme